MKYQIKSSSLIYRFIEDNLMYDGYAKTESLCTYIRQFALVCIWNVIAYAFIVTFIIGMITQPLELFGVLTMPDAFEKGEGILGIISSAGAVGWGLTFVIGAIIVFASVAEWLYHNRNNDKFTQFKKAPIVQYIVDKHNKVCRPIEVIEE